MNVFDIICLILLTYAGWKAFRKGFIIEIFGILALFAGIYGGIYFSDGVARWLSENVKMKDEWLPAAAFTATFLIVLIAVYFLGRMITKLLDIASLSLVNKIAGAFFGVLKWALIISVALMLFHPLNEQVELISKETKESSLLYQPIHDLSSTVIPALKESDFYKYLQEQEWITKELTKSADGFI
ncbi:MAG: membrane protein required for colicin V production [Flavobacteriales bacterium]|jgi:membrane protein required for colicin V production